MAAGQRSRLGTLGILWLNYSGVMLPCSGRHQGFTGQETLRHDFEPGPFATDVISKSSMKHAAPMAEYGANRPLSRHGDSDAPFAAEVHSFLR
jgi:hypothetical protein